MRRRKAGARISSKEQPPMSDVDKSYFELVEEAVQKHYKEIAACKTPEEVAAHDVTKYWPT
jgi:hypothetical protein